MKQKVGIAGIVLCVAMVASGFSVSSAANSDIDMRAFSGVEQMGLTSTDDSLVEDNRVTADQMTQQMKSWDNLVVSAKKELPGGDGRHMVANRMKSDVVTSKVHVTTMDAEPPEAVVEFNPRAKEIVVRGVDNVDEDVDVASVIIDSKPHKTIESYVLSDDAGNTLEITLEVKNREENVKATALSLAYNGRAPDILAENLYEVELKTEKRSDELEHLYQIIHTGPALGASTHYKAASNETRIDYSEMEEHTTTDAAGLVILALQTDRGNLSVTPKRLDTQRDSSGNLHMVYQDNRAASNFEVYYTNNVGIVGYGWNPPKGLSDTPADSVFPDIGIDPASGLIFVTWVEKTPAEDANYYTISRDNGANWQEQNIMFTELFLKADDFDPAREQPEIPGELTTARERGYYIVQFATPIVQEWLDGLQALGGEFYGYIPNNAFVVHMSEDVKKQADELPYVRWIGIYQPAYKVASDLLTKAMKRGAGKPVGVDISVFRNVDEVANEIRSRGGVAFVVSPTLMRAVVKDTWIREVSFMSDVQWMEKTPNFILFNDVAKNIMNVPETWTAHGLTGKGQIIAVADTGLDTGFITGFDDDGDGLNDEDTIDGFDNDGDGLIDEDDSNHDDFDGRVDRIHSWPIESSLSPYVSSPNADDGAADLDSGHGTHVTGSVLGDGARSAGAIRGAAYESRLIFQAVEQYVDWQAWVTNQYLLTDGYYLLGIPADLNDLFQQAYDDGARIHTNSWGTDDYGAYSIMSSQVDEFTWNHKGMVILFASGNAGTDGNGDGETDAGSVGSPATAKNSVSVGASENLRPTFTPTYGQWWPGDFPANPIRTDTMGDDSEGMAAFSSRGPTDDKRVKPDVVAPGTWILSTRSSQTANPLWLAFDNFYTYSGGTSMATPLTAGVIALVRQYYVDVKGLTQPSAALVKATLINGATDMLGQYTTGGDADGNGGAEPIPNEHEGWGRVNLTNSIFPESPRILRFRDVTSGFPVGAGGLADEYRYRAKSDGPLRISLVWTDYFAMPPTSDAHVNDLDLEVTAPDGTVYRGNVFANGESSAGGAFDTRNNTENVYIERPLQGEYRVRVLRTSVVVGPQPYALVVSYEPLAGTVLLLTTWGSNAMGIKNDLDAELGGPATVTDIWDWGPNGDNSLPPLSFMLQYEVVVVGTWDPVTRPELSWELGDKLAAYSDLGGGVVETYGSFDVTNGITGRWLTQKYSLIETADPKGGWEYLEWFVVPAHPLFKGVYDMSAFYTHSSLSGTEVLILYESKVILAAAGVNKYVPGGGRIVDLNYLPSSAYCTGDYMVLFANAVRFASI